MKLLISILGFALALPIVAQEATHNIDPVQVPGPAPTYQNVPPVPIAAPVINAVTATSSMHPGIVVVTGTNLARVRDVQIAGKPALILSLTDNEIRVRPEGTDPGWMDVKAIVNKTCSCTAQVEMYPTLAASLVPEFVGQPLQIRLANGDDGRYMIAANFELRPEPLVLNYPPTNYMFFLADDYATLSTGLVYTPDPMFVNLEVPPWLVGSGLVVHLQGWAQQDYAPHKYAFSFTNMIDVKL